MSPADKETINVRGAVVKRIEVVYSELVAPTREHIMKNSTPRAAYILANYRLESTPAGFVATSYYQGLVWAEIIGTGVARR